MFAMIIVGSSIVFGKIMVESIPVFLSSGLRFAIASVLLFVILFIVEKRLPKLSRKEVIILSLQSFTGVFLFSIFLLYGVQYTTAVESGLITSNTPIVIGVLSLLILKEKLTRKIVLSVILVALGISSINLVNSGEGGIRGDIPLIGNILIMLAVIGEALFTVFGKLLSRRLSPLAISAFVTFFGFVFFLPFALYEAMMFDFSQPSINDWGYVLYFAVVVTVIAFYLWYNGVSKVSGSVSGVFTGFLPVSTALLSYVFLNEQLTYAHLVGIMFVILGICTSSLFNKKV